MSNAKKKKQSTIARLPEQEGRNPPSNLNDKEKDIALLALIKKGGRSARPLDDEADQIQEKRISLRIPENIAERIKYAAKARPVPLPSHTWILEAVLEKLKKEGF